MGRSPSTIKALLSAATWVLSMGIAEHNIPRFFWKCVKAAENAWDDRNVLWGSVAALHTMAAKAQNPNGWWWQLRYYRRWQTYEWGKWRA